jgi:hypothetical protein
MKEFTEHPVASKAPYIWNLEINLQMNGEITRLSSRNHEIVFETSADKKQAKIQLHDQEKRGIGNDFVLYIRDNKINEPTAIRSVNEYNEHSILVNILPDLRAPKLKDRFLSKLKLTSEIDTE